MQKSQANLNLPSFIEDVNQISYEIHLCCLFQTTFIIDFSCTNNLDLKSTWEWKRLLNTSRP